MSHILKAILKQRSIQILIAVILYLSFSSFLSMEIHRGFYTISLLIKDLLLWLLPITVGLFVAHAISSFKKQALLFIIFLFAFETCSNSLSVWYSYGCGHLATHFLHAITPCRIIDGFEPLWQLPFSKPLWWSADKGTFAGIIIGLISSFKFPFLSVIIQEGKKIAEKILTKIFSRLIPLFILGFIARMLKTQILSQMFAQYTSILLWLILFLIGYIILLFFLGSDFSMRSFLKSIINLIPAASISFSSGCSLSTLPWTIEGASKNLKNPEFAKAILPATTNIQQIGDCIR